jgi:hypothetical protein
MKIEINKIIVFALFAVCLFQSKMYSQDFAPEDSTLFYSAAQTGIIKYLNKIPAGKESDFGFDSREEFSEIVLGESLRVFYLADSALVKDTKSPFISAKRWKIPLLVDGEFRCFLEIVFRNGEYKVVGIGLREVASYLGSFVKGKNDKTMKNKGLYIDYSYKIYCVVQKAKDNDLIFSPFHSMNSCGVYAFVEKNKYTANELVEIVKKEHKKMEKNEKK